MMMKLSYLSFVILTSASVVLFGCARQRETVVDTSKHPEKVVHTQEELKKTGRTETGPALEQVDPSIQTTGQH